MIRSVHHLATRDKFAYVVARILVEKNIYEKFKTEFIERTKQLTVGDPLDEKTKQGAIVSKMHFDKVMNCIEIAKRRAGRFLCGGTQ